MRNAVICVGMMLALLLIWPMAFGNGGDARVAAAQPVATIEVPPRAAGNVQSCRERHSQMLKACGASRSCRAEAARLRMHCEAGASS